LLDTDRQFKRFFEQETTEIPKFFTERIRGALGPFRQWLPDCALHHNPNAYLEESEKEEEPKIPSKLAS
jgi:hypothetical protein